MSPGHNYATPHFPSLYWPVSVLPGEQQYLYSVKDAWQFTLFWTLIVFEGSHLVAMTYALAVQWKNWKIMFGIFTVYSVLAGVEALMAGSVVGLLYVLLQECQCRMTPLTEISSSLGAVYKAGGFRMSTWIPFVWAVINALVLILSSFSIQGGL